jgi:hypothetical protein
MAPSSITSSYTNVVGKSPSETGRGGGREISYGRYSFKGGRAFNPKTGMEVPKSKLTIGEMGALEESKIDLSSQFSRGGGGREIFTDQTSGSRLGGMGVNIRGGSGGGSITNPRIREEADLMEFYDWKYGFDPRFDSTLYQMKESQKFGDFAKTQSPNKSYSELTPSMQGTIAGRYDLEKALGGSYQQSYMRAAGMEPNTLEFKQRYGQEYRHLR